MSTQDNRKLLNPISPMETQRVPAPLEIAGFSPESLADQLCRYRVQTEQMILEMRSSNELFREFMKEAHALREDVQKMAGAMSDSFSKVERLQEANHSSIKEFSSSLETAAFKLIGTLEILNDTLSSKE